LDKIRVISLKKLSMHLLFHVLYIKSTSVILMFVRQAKCKKISNKTADRSANYFNILGSL
jgi:hypothetical protein